MLTAAPCARTTSPCAKIAPAPAWTSPRMAAELAICGSGWSSSSWLKLTAPHRPPGLPHIIQCARLRPGMSGRTGRPAGLPALARLASTVEGDLNGPFLRAADDTQLDGAAPRGLERIEQVVGRA